MQDFTRGNKNLYLVSRESYLEKIIETENQSKPVLRIVLRKREKEKIRNIIVFLILEKKEEFCKFCRIWIKEYILIIKKN